MRGYDAATYGDRIADVYDQWYADYDEAAIDLLAGLAGGGRVLELGIGTGRLALPLAARGVRIEGIDSSPAMLVRLRARPGGEQIPVTLGDFGQAEPAGPFSLVFAAANTFFCLTTQEAQVQCFRQVAERLTEDGVFAIEVFVPDLARFQRDQQAHVGRIEAEWVLLELARHDPLTQQVMGQQIRIAESGMRLYPVSIRYAWPAELDLMAQLAGLRLRHRWADWSQGAFTATSEKHISVYGKAE